MAYAKDESMGSALVKPKPAVKVTQPAKPTKPETQGTSWSPPQVAGAGGMNRPYLGAPMRPYAQPVGRIPPFPAPNVIAPRATPTPTRTSLGYDQRNAPGIFPAIPTVPGPAAPAPGWGPGGDAMEQFLRLLGLK